ncbi:MAG: TIGR03084 family metal-binding protein [Panacagrimonas sp.]
MIAEIDSLRAEGAALFGLVQRLDLAGWRTPTPFKSWTPWDVIAHLHLSDLWASASLRSPADFRAEAAPLFAAIQQRVPLREFIRRRFEPLDGPTLAKTWKNSLEALCDALAQADPKVRLTWFGPDMGVRMFTTARYMETWAHAQDLHDLLHEPRAYDDRIEAIATLGVRTYEFCFRNRGRKPPEPAPYIRLVAPSGAIWEHHAPSDTDRIEGLASEFCHVLTQNRNVADTALRVTGEAAQQWMAIAQCFAGPPEDPPALGMRV